MASVNFPSPATNGQTYAYNGVTYTYDGVKWTAGGAGLWTRTGTVLSPTVAGDDVTTTGDVNAANVVATGDVQTTSLNGGQLAGMRNILINGNLTINQRGVDVATAATGSYGQDRWKKTAGGMTQIIEEGNFEPGATYTLSGTGITTQQLTAPASGNWTIPDVPVTARKIQLELGPVATPFEHRPIGLELQLCRRYYFNDGPASHRTRGMSTGVNAGNNFYSVFAQFPVIMRATPTVEVYSENGEGVAGLLGVSGYNRKGADITEAYSHTAESVAVRARDNTGDGSVAGLYFNLRANAEL